MKIRFSFTTLLLIVFLAIFFIPKLAFADGMTLYHDPYSDRWDYSNESNQQAFINYENGLQKMIISVGLEEENSEEVVWLFPVPADPEKVTIDIAENLPEFGGEEISIKAKSNMSYTNKFLSATQLYTIPFISFMGNSYSSEVGAGKSFGTLDGIGRGVEQDVVVYEHLDKEGISSEIITAKTANSLAEYLENRGLKIENGSIPVLDNYIGKDYSFVVSWISSPEEIISTEDVQEYLSNYYLNDYFYPDFSDLIDELKQKYPGFDETRDPIGYFELKENKDVFDELIQSIRKNPSITADIYGEDSMSLSNQKGVFVTFPTEEMYFPLLPTSVYGSEIVPATIRIIGHVSPKAYEEIKNYTNTGYYIDKYTSLDEGLENFYNNKNQEIRYTKVEINAPSEYFTDDLWFENRAPAKTYYSSFVSEHPIASALTLLILSSMIVGILIGWLLFKDLRKSPVRLGLIGLSNCFTIFGLLITIILIGTKNVDNSMNALLTEIKQKGYFWKRRIALILFIVATPFLTIGLVSLSYFSREIAYSVENNNLIYIAIPVLMLYILPVIALIVGFVLKKAKIEDKGLFEQLKSAGYSPWSFHTKDNMKIAFIPAFSVLFLAISWLLVKLVEITV